MNQNQNNVENIETNKITWQDGYITAESFVRAWQQSNSIKALQIKIAIAAKEQGKFQRDLDDIQRGIARNLHRIAALKSGSVECDALEPIDVCAINEAVYDSWEIPPLAAQIEDAERDSRWYAQKLTKAQERQDRPELCDWSCGDWGYVPGTNACQSRAARYRSKGVKLKRLAFRACEQPPFLKPSWEDLAELADELVVCN